MSGVEHERLKKQMEDQVEEILMTDDPIPKKMLVEDYVLEKARKACKALQEIYRGGIEWYGYSTSEKSNKRVVKDITFGKHIGMYSHTGIKPVEIAQVMDTLPKELTITGWIHSHNDIGTDFSLEDEKNMRVVSNGVFYNTRVISKYTELPVGCIGMLTPSKEHGSLLVKKEGEPLMVTERDQLANHLPTILVREDREARRYLKFLESRTTDIKVFVPVYLGWSYNIVVNNGGEVRQEISTIENRILSDVKVFEPRKKIDLEIIKTGRQVDYEALKKELKEKTKRGFFYPWWESGRKIIGNGGMPGYQPWRV